jgi:ubiquinone/menaquinone biosynthesis C-methylase UbiE
VARRDGRGGAGGARGARATSWNRIRYTFWAPLYDLVVAFGRQRRRAIELLALQPGERVLLVGAGTGADLPLLPEGIETLATDLTPAMLERARPKLRPGMELRVMDGQRLELPDASFDAVILNLVLAVMPDPVACLREVARVLRPGGRAVVFDKFLRYGERAGVGRRALGVVAGLLFTELDRVLEEILAASGAPLVIEHDEAALARGLFRVVLLRRR